MGVEPGSGDEESDALPRPYRPWNASGVPHPGAARPQSAAGADRGGPLPPRDLLPQPATRGRPPSAAAAPMRASRNRSAHGHRGYATGLALATAVTAWLPWFKLPATGLFDLSSATATRFTFTTDAWGLPASYLWSRTPTPGGLELGYLIALVALVILATAWIVDIPRAGVRAIGAVAALLPLLYLLQTVRGLDDRPVVPSGVQIGVTDLTGLGVYVLLVVGIAIVLVPPGRSA